MAHVRKRYIVRTIYTETSDGTDPIPHLSINPLKNYFLSAMMMTWITLTSVLANPVQNA